MKDLSMKIDKFLGEPRVSGKRAKILIGITEIFKSYAYLAANWDVESEDDYDAFLEDLLEAIERGLQ